MAITDEEKKILFEYLKSNQRDIKILLKDSADDKRDLMDKWESALVAISKLTIRVESLESKVNSATNKVIKENENVVASIEKGTEEIKDNLAGKTKVIIKRVEIFSFFKWVKSTFWKEPKSRFSFRSK